MTTQTTTGPKVIKRYSNRKLYDTENSKYITLKEIVADVTSGREVRVIENKTKRDVTGPTLVMALVETEQAFTDQTAVLHAIFKAGGLAKYVQGLKENQHQFVP